MDGGYIVLVIIGAVFTGAAVVIGAGIAWSLSGPAMSSATAGTPPTTCAGFCSAWLTSRIAVCTAQTALRTAQSWYNTIATMLAAATAAYTAALAAALAATYVPFLGPAIAAVLFSVAFTLLPAMITLLGALAGAAAAVLQRQGALNGALAGETTARSDVLSGCTPAEVSACFATPPPC